MKETYYIIMNMTQERLTCPCGAVYRSHNDYLRHFNTQMHKHFLTHQYVKCDICYNYKRSDALRKCKQCINPTCLACMGRIAGQNPQRMYKCPFCRVTSFPLGSVALPVLTFDIFDDLF